MGDVECPNVDCHCWSNPTTIVSVLLNPDPTSQEGTNGEVWGWGGVMVILHNFTPQVRNTTQEHSSPCIC